MKTNEELKHSMPRQISKLLTGGGPVGYGVEGDLGDTRQPNSTNFDIQSGGRGAFGDSMARQVSQSPKTEDRDIEDDSELYTPPPWYWLVRFDQMCNSPPRPVLVLREGLQSVNAGDVTTASGQVSSEQGVHGYPKIESSGIKNVVPMVYGIGRTSTLIVIDPAPSDGGLAGESDTTAHTSTPTIDSGIDSHGGGNSVSESNKSRSKITSGMGDGGSSTSATSPARNYNLRKRNPKL